MPNNDPQNKQQDEQGRSGQQGSSQGLPTGTATSPGFDDTTREDNEGRDNSAQEQANRPQEGAWRPSDDGETTSSSETGGIEGTRGKGGDI